MGKTLEETWEGGLVGGGPLTRKQCIGQSAPVGIPKSTDQNPHKQRKFLSELRYERWERPRLRGVPESKELLSGTVLRSILLDNEAGAKPGAVKELSALLSLSKPGRRGLCLVTRPALENLGIHIRNHTCFPETLHIKAEHYI